MSIFCRPLGHLSFLVHNGEGTELSVHTTTADVGRLRKKSAAASDWLGSEPGQSSVKAVTVKFGGFKGETGGHKISFSPGAWFSCDEQKDSQKGLFFNLSCTELEAYCCRGKLSVGRRRVQPVHRRRVLGGST